MTVADRTHRRPARVLERNVRVSRTHWYGPVLGLLEPFLFLFSFGVGIGELVDVIDGPDGLPIDYRTFVAPALLASAAMNTAVFATAFDFFAKYKWVQTYDAMLATPITTRDVIWGELAWILARIALSAVAFVVTMAAMGLIESGWGLFLIPTALLVGAAFGGAGFLAATFMRSWHDFDLIYLAVIPMFLFSASFFPLSEYPRAIEWIVRVTPLFHGVDLSRDLALGTVGWSNLVSLGYLVAMALSTLHLAARRLQTLLQP